MFSDLWHVRQIASALAALRAEDLDLISHVCIPFLATIGRCCLQRNEKPRATHTDTRGSAPQGKLASAGRKG